MLHALIALACVQEEAQELRWKYAPGEVLRYAMTQKVSTDAQGVPVRQELSTTVALEVVEVDPAGSGTFRARYEAVRARASGIQEYDYDSQRDREPPEDPAARMLSRLVGQSFTLGLGADGRVRSVRGYDRVAEAMSQAVPGDEALRARARQALGPMFSDEAFKSRMQQMVPPLPPGKVKKGDTWSNDFVVGLPLVGPVEYRIRSTFGGVKDGLAAIDQKIEIEFKGGDDPDHPLSGQVHAKEARGASSALFSLERGRFVSQKASVDLVLVVGKSSVPVRAETELKLLEQKP